MLIALQQRPEEIQRFRNAPWPFQRTFKTPLKDLNRFVSSLLAPFSLDNGVLSTDEVVFEPKNLLRELASGSGPSTNDRYEFIIRAAGQTEIARLLEAALGDWVDFVFVPTPELFAIYADHDEFTTLYSDDESRLIRLASALEKAGFEPVATYVRESSGDKWR